MRFSHDLNVVSHARLHVVDVCPDAHQARANNVALSKRTESDSQTGAAEFGPMGSCFQPVAPPGIWLPGETFTMRSMMGRPMYSNLNLNELFQERYEGES